MLRDNFKPVNSSDQKQYKTHGNESKVSQISKPEAKENRLSNKTESDEKEKSKMISSLGINCFNGRTCSQLNNDIVSADPVKSDIPRN